MIDSTSKKYIVQFVFLLVISLFVIFGLYSFKIWRNVNTFEPYDDKVFTSNLERQWYENNLIQAMKNDNYGGNTPEETLNLFVDALKKKDVELAAKYFVVDRQKISLESLNNGIVSGGTDKLINYLQNQPRLTKLDNSSYRIETQINGNFVVLFDLIKNTFSNKWKIESI